MTEELCRGLAAEGSGARRLELACYRVDGEVERAAIGTARASRDPRHLTRLFAEKIATLDPGLGIEDMVLTAPLAERLAAVQLRLRTPHPDPLPQGEREKKEEPNNFPLPLWEREGTHAKHGEGEGAVPPVHCPANDRGDGTTPSPRPSPAPSTRAQGGRGRSNDGSGTADLAALAALADRLGNRLGFANLRRLTPRESHLPERAVAILPALDGAAKGSARWPAGVARPIRLLAPPEKVEAMAPVPDDPPILFRWRRLQHRVRRADGPERIAAEWWRNPDPASLGDAGDIRDYYRVEDEDGRRFWLFRAGLYRPAQNPHGRPARWFIHGIFA